ncbi:MAG: hypothetical protein M1827_007407 [Pycnora praestabilis]|nr:MAG: hypothetical protein M1827_007407 [Pycnora praestabilis]
MLSDSGTGPSGSAEDNKETETDTDIFMNNLQQVIQAAVAAAVVSALAEFNQHSIQAGPAGSAGSVEPEEPWKPEGDAVAGTNNCFIADDIGYFNPHLDKFYDKDNIVHFRKNMYYHNIHLFIGMAKDVARTKNIKKVCHSLHTCLCSEALQ